MSSLAWKDRAQLFIYDLPVDRCLDVKKAKGEIKGEEPAGNFSRLFSFFVILKCVPVFVIER
jgi:hypothetical protein